MYLKKKIKKKKLKKIFIKNYTHYNYLNRKLRTYH